MKERPILFNAAMVRAIIEGQKTKTRREVKLRDLLKIRRGDATHYKGVSPDAAMKRCITDVGMDGLLKLFPYGQPGDQLWVREAWRIGAWDENRPAFALDYCDGARKEWIEVPDAMGDGELFDRLWQQSSDDAAKALGIQDRYQWEPGQSPCRWRPSIHMPRWASRIQLEITGIRVERLQDISEADALAEGIYKPLGSQFWHTDPSANILPGETPQWAYRNLWESINGHGSWEANPWVWVIEFKRLT